MTIGLVGRKSGMTRVFTEDGVSIPVTVVEVSPNRVTQIKEVDSDGYRAIQVTAGSRKASRVSNGFVAGNSTVANDVGGVVCVDAASVAGLVVRDRAVGHLQLAGLLNSQSPALCKCCVCRDYDAVKTQIRRAGDTASRDIAPRITAGQSKI